jgi:hypothetical protein
MRDPSASPKPKSVFPTFAGFYLLSAVLLIGYIVVYQFVPFGDKWNDFVLNLTTDLASLFVAVMATLIFRHYQPEEFPRKVWKNIMIASWLWVAAEVIWGVLDLRYDEVPIPGPADLAWVAGFVYFTIAFYHQYSIIAPAKKETIRNYAVGAWAVVLLIPLALLLIMHSFNLATYIDFYYPFADLAVGVAGIALVFIFRGGALMRPWLGLFVFGLSDLLYAWAEKTGVYAWSAANSNLLTLFIDSSYILAYLILAMGFVGHWMLITYGLRSMRNNA